MWIIYEITSLWMILHMKRNERKYKSIIKDLATVFPQLLQGIEVKVKKINWTLCFLTFTAVSLSIYSASCAAIKNKTLIRKPTFHWIKDLDDIYIVAYDFLYNLFYMLLALMKIQLCILFVYLAITFSQAFDSLNKSLETYGSVYIHSFFRQHKKLCDLLVKADTLMSVPMTTVIGSFLFECLACVYVFLVNFNAGNMFAMIPQIAILAFVCHFGQELHAKVCVCIFA